MASQESEFSSLLASVAKEYANAEEMGPVVYPEDGDYVVKVTKVIHKGAKDKKSGKLYPRWSLILHDEQKDLVYPLSINGNNPIGLGQLKGIGRMIIGGSAPPPSVDEADAVLDTLVDRYVNVRVAGPRPNSKEKYTNVNLLSILLPDNLDSIPEETTDAPDEPVDEAIEEVTEETA